MKAQRVLCVEISTNALKFLDVLKSPALTVRNAGVVRLENEPKSRLPLLLKRALPAQGHPGPVAVSFWAPSVVVRKISMPLMTPEELKGAIRFEVEKHIPFSVDDCVLDTSILQKNPAQKQMELLLVAAKKGLVSELRELVVEAGLEPAFFDIHPFALANAFECWSAPAKTGAPVLVQVGEKTPTGIGGANFVAILKEGKPVVVRNIGGGESASGAAPGFASDALLVVTEGLKGAVGFFENSSDEETGDFFIAGEGASDAAMLAGIENAAGRKVEPLDFAARFQYERPEDRELISRQPCAFTVCFGLAARVLGP